MASMKVAMEGLDELRAALKALPEDLARDARFRVRAAANAAADDLRAAYPSDSGNLRRGVRVAVEDQAVSVVATVKSSSPHAHLWEFGTQVRRTQRLLNRGAAPAHFDQGLVGIAQRRRRDLNEELVDIVRKAGFEVTGE